MTYTSLYKKIAVRLSLPMIVLAFLFTAVQLLNQINHLNHLTKVENIIAIDSVKAELPVILGDLEKDPKDAKSQVDSLVKQHNIQKLDIFTATGHLPALPGDRPIWSDFDQTMSENFLVYNTHYTTVHPADKTLISYVRIADSLNGIKWIARLTFSLSSLQTAIATSRWSLFTIILFVLITAIIIAQTLSAAIIAPIKKLDEATREIMTGHLGKHVNIHTGDEIEKLAETFNQMSETLKQMQERAADSNPLTNFPGNKEIFREIQKRIVERQKFVLFHIDLDRFKIFNDAYGLVRGDEVLHRTAELITEAKKNKGTESDFIGHQGGDDFILITRPNHANSIAQYIIGQFDQRIVASMYKSEDFKNGYILAPDRRGAMVNGEPILVKFPLMAISLAGVSTAKRDFADYNECMIRTNGVKKEVKRDPKSCYRIIE